MRIISKFKDYYDSCQDHLDTYVWERETEFIPFKRQHGSQAIEAKLFEYINRWAGADTTKQIVGFCGKLYPRLVLNDPKTFNKKIYFESLEQVKQNEHLYFSNHWSNSITKFLNLEEIEPFVKSFFYTYKCPIFVFGIPSQEILVDRYRDAEIGLILNPNLKEFEWQKKFDSWQTYQEIEMFLKNNLVEDATDKIKIEDKYKIEAHGYDKWSFRKMPEKKK